MSKSTKSVHPSKPTKPYPDFPLFPHATRRWAKKIRGKLHYFGPWNDPQGALQRFNQEWPYLSEGRTPPPIDTGDGCTVQDLCNTFLNSKRNQLDSGELSRQTFADYYKTCERLIDQFSRDRRVDDLRPDDFEAFRASLARQFATFTLKNEINRARVVLKYGYDQRLIDRPVNYGQSFNRPSAKTLRKARNAAGPRLFESAELRKILDAIDGKAVVPNNDGKKPKALVADPILKAMVLLGINCGFGNTDIASLPQSAVDFESGWVEFPRPKTEVQRRVPLWLETTAALQAAIAIRPKPKGEADANLCFVTVQGNRWVRTTPSKSNPQKYVTVNTIAQRFGALLKRLKINGRRGLGFYTLRHVFETIGGESTDQVAVDSVMGHVDTSMAAHYRERISDERLRAVTDCVHKWLFGSVKRTR